jgi:hypothetical protein
MPSGRTRQQRCAAGHPLTKDTVAWRKCGEKYIVRDCRPCRHLRGHIRKHADLRYDLNHGLLTIEHIEALFDAEHNAKWAESQMRLVGRRRHLFEPANGSWLEGRDEVCTEYQFIIDCGYWADRPPPWIWCWACQFALQDSVGIDEANHRQRCWFDIHRFSQARIDRDEQLWAIFEGLPSAAHS